MKKNRCDETVNEFINKQKWLRRRPVRTAAREAEMHWVCYSSIRLAVTARGGRRKRKQQASNNDTTVRRKNIGSDSPILQSRQQAKGEWLLTMWRVKGKNRSVQVLTVPSTHHFHGRLSFSRPIQFVCKTATRVGVLCKLRVGFRCALSFSSLVKVWTQMVTRVEYVVLKLHLRVLISIGPKRLKRLKAPCKAADC